MGRQLSIALLVCLVAVLAGTSRGDLVAHWTMDQADSDPNYLDVTGNGHMATVVGSPVFVADVLGTPGSAVEISGSNGCATAGTLNPSAANNQMTISAWVNITGTLGATNTILAKRTAWGGGTMMWQLHFNSSAKLEFGHSGGIWGTFIGVDQSVHGIDANEWHLVTVTHDGASEELRIYVDGKVVTTGSISLQGATDALFDIGMSNPDGSGGASEAFPGKLDDVRVYDTVLTDAEVLGLYRAVIAEPTVVSGPVETVLDAANTPAVLTCTFISEGLNQAATWYRQIGDKDADPAAGDDIAVDSLGDPDVSTLLAATGNPNEYQATLTINYFTAEDEADYYCVVADTSGTDISPSANVFIKRQLAHWTLDQADFGGAADPNFYDVSGNGHDAAVRGTATFVPDLNGDADGAITISDPNNGWADAGTWNPSVTGQMTVSLWVKAAGTGIILAKRDSWNSADMMWQLGLGGSTINMQTAPFNTQSVNFSEAGMAANEWHLLTVTHDGATNDLDFYVDGEFVGNRDFGLGSDTESHLRIGVSDVNAEGLGNEIFNGSLDDIRIYNYAMDAREVLDLYNETNATADPDKVLCLDPYAAVLDVAGPDTVIDDITTFVAEPDCRVDLNDFMVMAYGWLTSGQYPVVE